MSEKSWTVSSTSSGTVKMEQPAKPVTREDFNSESLNFIYFLDSCNCEQISSIGCQIFLIQTVLCGDYLPTMSAKVSGKMWKVQVAGTSEIPETLVSLSRYLLIHSSWLTLGL